MSMVAILTRCVALCPAPRLFYMESPTSWLMHVHDVAALARIARENDALSIIDNSWASPVFQQPLTLGADLVVHSASKYIGGHSDVVAGVVVGSKRVHWRDPIPNLSLSRWQAVSLRCVAPAARPANLADPHEGA